MKEISEMELLDICGGAEVSVDLNELWDQVFGKFEEVGAAFHYHIYKPIKDFFSK